MISSAALQADGIMPLSAAKNLADEDSSDDDEDEYDEVDNVSPASCTEIRTSLLMQTSCRFMIVVEVGSQSTTSRRWRRHASGVQNAAAPTPGSRGQAVSAINDSEATWPRCAMIDCTMRVISHNSGSLMCASMYDVRCITTQAERLIPLLLLLLLLQ